MQACYCKMVALLMRIASIGNKMLAKIYWYKIMSCFLLLCLSSSSAHHQDSSNTPN